MKKVTKPFRRDVARDDRAQQYLLVQGLEAKLSEEGRAVLLEVAAGSLPEGGQIDFEVQEGQLREFVFALSPPAAKQLSRRLDEAVEAYLGSVPEDQG